MMLFIALGASFLVTYVLIPFIRKAACVIGLLDVPDGIIKHHQAAVPYLGGVGVYLGFIAGVLLTVPGNLFLYSLLPGLTLLLCVGLIDDMISLTPSQKFTGQIFAGICFLYMGAHLKLPYLSNGFNYFISLAWILVITNALNLVDVMDGLAASLAAWTTFGFLCIAFSLGDWNAISALLAFMGSITAFLFYNSSPATIYLGDAGALFIGGFLATIPFFFNWATFTPYGYLAPVVLLGIPLFELLSLIVIRSYKGIWFYRGSSDHFCHYMQKKGWSIQHIIGISSAISVFLVGFSMILFEGLVPDVFILIMSILFVVGWFKLY